MMKTRNGEATKQIINIIAKSFYNKNLSNTLHANTTRSRKIKDAVTQSAFFI